MAKRTIEVFSAGCALRGGHPAGDGGFLLELRCAGQGHDRPHDPTVVAQAKKYGINRVPAVVINGQLADCCSTGKLDIGQLRSIRSMGLGAP